ncbi:hypothetical protein FDECE_12378 [Fusarium decemcellulare]|nr:hypothetical protein FDECE_12378 [Fusarium decemcellulare]
MFSFLLIAAFGVALVLGQASYGSESFKYWGCATVDQAGFGEPVQLPNGVLSPDSCQAACAGYMFAAISPDACRCGNDPNAIKSVDEDSCNHPCFKDPNSPMCGGICPDGTPDASTLFIIEDSLLRDDDVPEPGSPGDPPVPSNVAQSLFFPEQSAASDALPVETSLPPSPPESEVTQGLPPPTGIIEPSPEIPAPIPPPASAPVDSAPNTSENGPEPTVPAPTETLSSTVTLPQENPSLVSAPGLSISTWEVPGIPPKSSKLTASETLLSEPIPEPDPSLTSTNDGEPVPSLVTTSESSQFDVPILTALGELLLIAAMVA